MSAAALILPGGDHRRPFVLGVTLGSRTILCSYPTERWAVAMAPAFLRALIQAQPT